MGVSPVCIITPLALLIMHFAPVGFDWTVTGHSDLLTILAQPVIETSEATAIAFVAVLKNMFPPECRRLNNAPISRFVPNPGIDAYRTVFA